MMIKITRTKLIVSAVILVLVVALAVTSTLLVMNSGKGGKTVSAPLDSLTRGTTPDDRADGTKAGIGAEEAMKMYLDAILYEDLAKIGEYIGGEFKEFAQKYEENNLSNMAAGLAEFGITDPGQQQQITAATKEALYKTKYTLVSEDTTTDQSTFVVEFSGIDFIGVYNEWISAEQLEAKDFSSSPPEKLIELLKKAQPKPKGKQMTIQMYVAESKWMLSKGFEDLIKDVLTSLSDV